MQKMIKVNLIIVLMSLMISGCATQQGNIYTPEDIVETCGFKTERSRDFEKFYTNDINYFELTNPNDVVLEVKFDRFLEPYISKILEQYTNRYQSVSKYVMGRNEY